PKVFDTQPSVLMIHALAVSVIKIVKKENAKISVAEAKKTTELSLSFCGFFELLRVVIRNSKNLFI
ncbi:TPA: hypothetical protein ACWZ62_004968, partial [Escherichia coli]